MDIPETYAQSKFSTSLVPSDLGDVYKNKLQSIYNDITTLKWKGRNLILCSPALHSKSILAYTCMQVLFRRGLQVFPMLDVLELHRTMLELDTCRKTDPIMESPESMYTVPYLFVRVPAMLTFDVYSTMSTLVYRRVSRGGSTIFLYNGTWGQLTAMDSRRVLAGLQGDGSGNSIEVSSWSVHSSD